MIGISSFDEAYSNLLSHRIVHVLIINSKKELLLQLRSAQKSFCPLHWSTAVGGHVQSGETYEAAARREFEEELGEGADLVLIGKYRYVVLHTGQIKFLSVFRAHHDGPFHINKEEVERADFFTREKVEEMIQMKEKFHPELLFLLEKPEILDALF